MDSKQQLIAMLREIYTGWEDFLSRLSEDRILANDLSDGQSIRDILAHLWAWQQLSVVHMEAALRDIEPDYSQWPDGDDPDTHNTDEINAWISEKYRDLPWPQVYESWKANFRRFIELSESVPEDILLDPHRFGWLHGYSLGAVLEGSYEHHDEHLVELQERSPR